VLLERIRETNLANGLKVLSLQDQTSPTASLSVFYRVGSRNEHTGVTGISHIFEHLMFKGTARHPEGSFDRILQENGMTYNAFTTHDFTAYFETMAADRLEIALELESDRMQGLELNETSFQSEMAVIREERRQTVEDPPFGLLSEAVEAAVFQVHPYHWPVIGWMSDLERISLEDVARYYRDYYRPNNAVLVLAGDLDHGRAAETADRWFGGIPRGPELPAAPTEEPEQRGERMVSIGKPVQLPGLLLAYPAPRGVLREAKVLNVIEFILLHGRSSRLYQRLIYQEQLASGLGGGIHLRGGPSVFKLRTTARPGIPIARVRDVILEILEELGAREVSGAELDKAKRAIEAEYVFAQESHLEVAHNLGEDECRSSWREYLGWCDEQLTVTPEEILRVAARTFDPRRRTVGYLVPEGASESAPAPSPEEGEAR
jgi:zinc protease